MGADRFPASYCRGRLRSSLGTCLCGADAAAAWNEGGSKTVVAALLLEGIGLRLHFDRLINTDRITGYGWFVLALTLRPGQVVLADDP
jgi:hypothetical protein